MKKTPKETNSEVTDVNKWNPRFAAKTTKTVKHFGGRHTSFHLDDGTVCNVYSDFRPGVDCADPSAVKADSSPAKKKNKKIGAPLSVASDQATSEKPKNKNNMNTTNTKAVKASAPAATATVAGTPSKKDIATAVENFLSNPPAEALSRDQIYARIGSGSNQVYQMIRTKGVVTGKVAAGVGGREVTAYLFPKKA